MGLNKTLVKTLSEYAVSHSEMLEKAAAYRFVSSTHNLLKYVEAEDLMKLYQRELLDELSTDEDILGGLVRLHVSIGALLKIAANQND